ncbi:hypothetical protein LJC71_07950 [Desulfosarcina sp. OttesenSCG-928-A07]|nr:hypothetical protein [Desulfosarcina sp. OttesenSCG-928-G17]MDL2329658.1 hypothetical protein [Desulfosarcina sp. OttesenSCG-928-A07]
MLDKFNVPSELAGSLKRIIRRIPVELKKDEELIRTIIAYLELGGERLAGQAVEAAKQTLELEEAQQKKKAREEALIRAAEAKLATDGDDDGDEEEGDGDDDLMDDDDIKVF